MPIKLSGKLVEEARRSAKRSHRSLTGQIEHWATLGRVLESQIPGEAADHLLERIGGTMKIDRVAEPDQRQHVAGVLAEILGKSASTNHPWLREISARDVPLYGTVPDHPGRIARLNSDGSREILPSDADAPT